MEITIGTTYYNNPENLDNFISTHIDYVDHMYIVDDGSDDPAARHIKNNRKITLFRVIKDIGFNSHGCRNLIMKQTQTDWNVLMDADRMFIDPDFAFEQIKNRKLHPSTLYLFEMFSSDDSRTIHPSVNDFLVHKDHFWSAGGYDEENIGMRFGDREFRIQLEHFGNERIFYGIYAKFIRGPSKHDKPIYSKEAYERAKKIIDRRMRRPDPTKKTITFKWEKVF